MSAVESDAVSVADATEAEAWAAMYRLAPAPLGLAVESLAGATLLIAPRVPLGLLNRVIGLGVFEPASDRVVDDVVARFRFLGASTCWIHVSPMPHTANLASMLVRRGFALAPRPTWAKVLRGSEAPAEIATPFLIREIGPEHASELSQILVSAHGMPPPVAPWNAALVGARCFRAFAAFDGERIVAGAFLFTSGDRAWLGLGGTAAPYRNRGAQGALMVARIRAAIDAGARYIATETGEPIDGEPNPSLSNMYRCGFERVAARTNYVLAL